MEALPIGNQREAAGQMLSIAELGAATDEHAASRRIRRMQPAGGVGDKLFPPTYPPRREGPCAKRRRLKSGRADRQRAASEQWRKRCWFSRRISDPVALRHGRLSRGDYSRWVITWDRHWDTMPSFALLDTLHESEGGRRRRRRQPRCWIRHRRYVRGLPSDVQERPGWTCSAVGGTPMLPFHLADLAGSDQPQRSAPCSATRT